MADTYYLDNTVISANLLDTLATVAPGARDTYSAWKVGKGSANFAFLVPDTEQITFGAQPAAAFTTGYRTAATLSKTYAAGSWVLDGTVRSGPQGGSQAGKVYVALGRTSNADGSGATLIKDWFASATITFTAVDQDQTFQITITSVPEVTFSGEYLFVAFLWERTVSGGHNNARVLWVHHEGAAEQLVTTDEIAARIPRSASMCPFLGG
jgi:hypothetical protein